MLETSQDKQLLIGCIIGSFFAYHSVKRLAEYLRKGKDEWVPVGLVKSLHIYPVKSTTPIDLFSFKCTEEGPTFRELTDRNFLVIDGPTGRFYTARQVPKLVKLKCNIEDNILSVDALDGSHLAVNLLDVIKQADVRRATLFNGMKQDGLDCGDAAAQFFANYTEEPDVRLIMHRRGLYTERTCVPHADWWNTPVPKRKDDSGFTDLAPFHINTTASLVALNERLGDSQVSTRNFRPSIVVDGCLPWDEDKWAEIRIGDAQLECFAPCTRCVLTTVDPETGKMNTTEQQPLRKLREFRLAPEGKMRQSFKDSPVFGVYAGLKNEAYIHVGQTVYVRYKPTAF